MEDFASLKEQKDRLVVKDIKRTLSVLPLSDLKEIKVVLEEKIGQFERGTKGDEFLGS
jgi:hypothetical protein